MCALCSCTSFSQTAPANVSARGADVLMCVHLCMGGMSMHVHSERAHNIHTVRHTHHTPYTCGIDVLMCVQYDVWGELLMCVHCGLIRGVMLMLMCVHCVHVLPFHRQLLRMLVHVGLRC